MKRSRGQKQKASQASSLSVKIYALQSVFYGRGKWFMAKSKTKDKLKTHRKKCRRTITEMKQTKKMAYV